MKLTEADLRWLQEHYALVWFTRVDGTDRCMIRCAGGFPWVERETFEEAFTVAKDIAQAAPAVRP